jgi:hypothetical protein
MAAVISILASCALAYAIFWALVIFPTFASFCTAIAIAGASYFLLYRFSISDKRITRNFTKKRRNLGY